MWQTSWKALRDKRYWTSTRSTTTNKRSKEKDTKLAGVRRSVSKKEVEVAVEKNYNVQHENHADQIEAVACRRKEEVSWLTNDIDSLQDVLESSQEWREESNRQAREIKDLEKK